MGKIHLKDAEGYQLPELFHTPDRNFDCVRYARALGVSPLDRKSTPFWFEEHPGLTMLPPYMGALAMRMRMQCNDLFHSVNWPEQALAVGQKTIIHDPHELKWSAEPLKLTGSIVNVTDKGPGKPALFTVEIHIYRGGVRVATCQNTVMLKGAGGFGGNDRKAERLDFSRCERQEPVARTCYTVPPGAAVDYSPYDMNLLHRDPKLWAPRGEGDEQIHLPILQGLCTKGIAGLALLQELCHGHATRWLSQSASFTAPVCPTDTIEVLAWNMVPGGALYRVLNVTTGKIAIEGAFDYVPSGN